MASFTKVFKGESAWGGNRAWFWDVTMDTSYAAGGYTKIKDALSGKQEIMAILAAAGNKQSQAYTCYYDKVNDKLVIGTKDGTYPRGNNITSIAGALITEEVVAVASNAGQLARIPAYIIAVHVTAGSVTGAFSVIPTGETPITTQVAVNFTTGAMAFLSSDAVTSVKVTYIPLGVGPFVPANRVIDESVTLSASKVNLANRAALVQYVWDDTDGVLDVLIPQGEAPAATHEAAVDINDSGNTSIDVHADDEGNTGKVTYWKHTALSPYGFVDQADITVSSDAALLTETNDLAGIFIPCFGCKLVGEATATNLQATFMGPSGTAAANVAVYTPGLNKIATANADGYTTYEMGFIVLDGAMIAPVPGEVANGVNIANVTFSLTVIARN